MDKKKTMQFKLPFKLLSGYYYNKFVKQQEQQLSHKKKIEIESGN